MSKTVSLQDWLDDNEGAQIRHTMHSLYLDALLHGVTDRRVIANSLALAEASAILAKKHPDVPFDDIADVVLSYVSSSSTRQYHRAYWRWYLWLSLQHRYYTWRWHLRRPWRWLKRLFATPAESQYRNDKWQ